MKTLLDIDLLLQQVKVAIEKNNQIAEETGRLFNIFSILNMERLEVRTHSALLYELLNPKGSHFQGCTYLDVFIKEVLEIDDFDLNNVKVERERNTNGLGRMDLIIENQEHLIIIEIKIDAGEQENQLKRYNKYGMISGKDYNIYYLTLFGYEASDYSTGNIDIDYKCISFEIDILNWINKCIGVSKTPLLPSIREILVQYSKLIEKITNQLDGGVKMEIKDLLFKENNLKIAEQIAKVIPYCRAELEYKFWKVLYSKYNNKVKELGLEYVDDGFFKDEKSDIEDIVEIRKKKNGDFYLEYKVRDYGNKNLYLYIGCDGNDDYIYVSLGLGTEDENISFKEYDEKMINIIEELGFIKSSRCAYEYIEYDLNFHTDSLLKLQDEHILNMAVKSIGDEFLDIIRRIVHSKKLNSMLND